MTRLRKIASTLLVAGLIVAQPLSAYSETAQAQPGQAPVVQTQAVQTVPKLTLEQQTALRCSAVFAIIAAKQASDDEDAREFPPLGDRGKEFFVRTAARLMDELDTSREVIAGLAAREAQLLLLEKQVKEVMPACLLLLDASGL